MAFDYWGYLRSISPRNQTFQEPGGSLGPDPTTEYSGDSPEEFYDYLMAPRHHQRWSGSGAIKHYGPDRYASIRPEDAAMADILQKQMEAEAEKEFKDGIRRSETARRRAMDDILMPKGGGGGTISFRGEKRDVGGGWAGPAGTVWGHPEAELPVGGGMPAEDYKPAGPPASLTEGQRSLLTGQESRTAEAGARYSGMRGGRGPTELQIAQAQRDLAKSAAPLLEQARLEEGDWGTLDAEGIFNRYKEDPGSIPPMMKRALDEYMAQRDYVLNLFGGQRETWGGPGG
jgi:hypothetical protein